MIEMKKILIIAIIAVMGLSMTSCKCTRTQATEEEVVEAVDTVAVADTVAVDSTLVAE